MRRTRTAFITIGTVVLTAGMLRAAGISVQGSVDRKEATVGDPVRYELKFNTPAGYRLELSSGVPRNLGAWEVRGRSVTPAKGNEPLTLRYTLSAFTTGQLVVPEETYTFRTPDGTSQVVRTSSVTVAITSLLAKLGDKGLRDIKPPQSVPHSPWWYMLRAAVVAALGTLAWSLWKRLRRRSGNAGTTESTTPKIPPYEAAIAALDELSRADLPGQGRIKEYYSALDVILRDFLAGVYRIETRDRTTAETMAALKGVETERGYVSGVRNFFETCDLVKFARHTPEQPECAKDLETVRGIIEARKPQTDSDPRKQQRP